MANFKGTVFESVKNFTAQQLGADAYERILAELSDDDRAVLTDVTALGWYPVGPILRYHHALDRLFGKGDFVLCEEAGRFSAGWSMNHVLKVFLRFRTPTWLVERSTSVWSRYHDTGRWEIAASDEHRMHGNLYDFAVRDPAFCARLRGWLAGAAALTGGQNVVVTETQCVTRGARHCSFATTWR